MGHIRAAAILAIDNRLKCLGTRFGGANKRFQSLGTQHGRRVIKVHCHRTLPQVPDSSVVDYQRRLRLLARQTLV